MKRPLIIGLFAVASTVALFGQFGGIVFDPTTDADVIVTAGRVLQEIQTLRQALAVAQSTYAQLQLSAQYMTRKNAWAYLMTAPSYATTPNLYGSSGGWIQAINTGVNAAAAYELATMRVLNPGALLGSLSTAGQAAWAAHYGSIELSDALTQNTMNVTGSVRGNLMAQQAALTGLQASVLSDDPDTNTEAGILNQISGGTLIQASTLQDSNQLLSVIADQNTIAAKLHRDVLVDEINNAAAAQASSDATVKSLWTGTSAAIGTRF